MLCLICGDSATGNHYTVLSCKPCKSFFRNNALIKLKECRNLGKCDINKLSRRFCPSCRMKKCLELGMKKELVLFHLSNKQHHVNWPDLYTFENIISDRKIINEEDLKYEIKKLEEYISSDDSNSNIINCLEESCSYINRPINENKNKFNDMEVYYISELLNATNMFIPTDKIIVKAEITDWKYHMEYSFHVQDYMVRKYITACNSLKPFKELCEDDKIILIKNSVLDAMLIQSVNYYNLQNHSWRYEIHGASTSVNLDLIKQASQDDVYDMHLACYNYIVPVLASDRLFIDILNAIALFNPNQPRLKHKDVVTLQQQFYIYLLKRYLKVKYTLENDEINSKLSDLMKIFIYIVQVKNGIYSVMKNDKFNIKKYMSPFLKEIYDIN